MHKFFKRPEIIILIVILFLTSLIVPTLFVGGIILQEVLIYLFVEEIDDDSGNIHTRSYLFMQRELGVDLAEDLAKCSINFPKYVCTYGTKDRYYFFLSRKSFGYNEFDRPSVTLRDGKIILKLVNTTIKLPSANESYGMFYINKSDFPEAKGVMLNYYLYDEDWNILEHKEEPLVFPNFDVKLRLSYPEKVK